MKRFELQSIIRECIQEILLESNQKKIAAAQASYDKAVEYRKKCVESAKNTKVGSGAYADAKWKVKKANWRVLKASYNLKKARNPNGNITAPTFT